ncbi:MULTISPECIES: NAD-glutamate dehydrogenase [unclassified Arthrobacter]|uniref:NAD-glutamate dehydrogenase n=1 Tax=unclassified Arthrobacter TaxID=235627 RepID=UPI001E4F9D0D|nr:MULTISPECIES: NAD-glutamate dehydrogenase [unclassified Arthrobacter]MCC9146452.1 NAD-glutamate dehydrogenase [Arthrobacter sp. zg-Y919]MDK1277682.1 NAD-glutamate dehydrogenase [Arthrobacter sp. zg.Y919]WIB02358.1 NAD-glutamate dehydrogenase [Arthrobacter sp. zg-Y919]
MSSGSRIADLFSSDTSLDEFIGNYYEHLAREDAQAYEPSVLRERAQKHMELALTRAEGTAAVDVVDQGDTSVILIVTDDMPFLVDSVTAEVVRRNAAIRLVVHPIFLATRDPRSGELQQVQRVPATAGVSSGDTAALPNLADLMGGNGGTTKVESWIAIDVARITDADKRIGLIEGLKKVLGDVRIAVSDWPAMRSKVHEIARSLETVPGAREIPDLQQARELLTWLDNGNFTFLGYREYDLITEDGEDALRPTEDSGLGLLRLHSTRRVQRLTGAGRAKAREKRALVITKANSRSTVHRPAYLDYLGVKRFDEHGNVNGERRFIGLFATGAYTGSVRSIPIVRDKVREVMRTCGFPADSHSGKDLLSILETYPRDELFQIDPSALMDTSLAILRLQERRRTRLFLRPDIYGRFMSAIVFLPRDRYTTPVRLRIQDELRSTFKAESIDFEARMTESALARLFLRIRLPRGQEITDVDAAALEARLVQATRSWGEGIEEVVRTKFSRREAEKLSALWADAFPAAYRVAYEVEDALEDIARFEARVASPDTAPELFVYIPSGDGGHGSEDARLKLYLTEPKSLTQILPFLHNLGLEVLDERPFEIQRADGTTFYLYDLGLVYPAGIDPLQTGTLLAEAFRAGLSGTAESDAFDRLILRQGLRWRQVVILRAYAKYMRQVGTANSYGFVAGTLLANPDVAHALIALFEGRFDPDLTDEERRTAVEQAGAALERGLEQVPTLDADRVLRTFANLINATLRTNFYQDKAYVSFKLNTGAIEGAPFPRPKYEIWVYSPRVEGVHLRFGEVARGGLRWSDRREDFRTEVLGLVKAQTVKNAVIVPTGAKGGFYAKKLPDPAVDRGAWMEDGKNSYRTFIRGLLDLTDNLVVKESGEEVVPPERVVRHDGDDSYLVVAADKGTASFSDIANSISAEYGFWLGDAFASGGSVGYDHKAMGITARGAWESVKRHFSELDLDTQSQDFTVVGVGDMSGDVFGNGMLLSKHIKLVAAFDHRHIFLDPNPDAARSHAERQRLFELPRSSWADYDESLISAGGGIFPRQSKSIPLSEEVRRVLGLPSSATKMSPPELLKAILTAPVDLLYNGGIGTYVKSSDETSADVGDKANDAIRVDGRDLRVKVVGEGGNLGMTQRGRIEAARAGVILNTDAIDNSAGVDCSDHEVNIKIFVDRMVAAGRLDPEERAAFLHSMTDEVGHLVLQDNVDQNMLLLNDRQRVLESSPSFERLMDWLEEHADLDRELEALPTNEELHARIAAGEGLTSPELAVLAAYAKIELTKALTRSNLADDPYFAGTLRRYFPKQIVERFGDQLDTHPLRREIISTVVANDMINIGGITFAFRIIEETSATEAEAARAFTSLREIYGIDKVLAGLGALPADFPTQTWSMMHLDLRRLLDRAVRWFVNHVGRGTTIDEDIEAFRPVLQPLLAELTRYLRGGDAERVEAMRQKARELDIPQELGKYWAEQFESFGLLDVALASRGSDEPAAEVAGVYYAVYDKYGIDGLLDRITNLPREDRWQSLARGALRDDLYSTVADMTVAVLDATPDQSGTDPGERLHAWEQENADNLERASKMFNEVNRLEQDDMASLSVALRVLRSIVRR